MELPYKNKIYISVSYIAAHHSRDEGAKTHHIIPVEDENALAVFCVVSFGIFHVELAGLPFTSLPHIRSHPLFPHASALLCTNMQLHNIEPHAQHSKTKAYEYNTHTAVDSWKVC